MFAMGRLSAWAARGVALALSAVIVALTPPAHVHGDAGIQLLSGVGYHSNGQSPSVLIGAEYVATSRTGSFFTGLEETRLALHLSDVISVDAGSGTYTVGVEGGWSRRQGGVQLGAEASLHYRHGDAGWARIAGIGARGVTGRVQGALRVDYVENAYSTFPWFLRDLNGVAPRDGEDSFYRATASLSALVLPAQHLTWSQEIRWRKPAAAGAGNLGMTTGPEFRLGNGKLATQAGILLKPGGIEPLGQVRYELQDPDGRYSLLLAAATASVEGDGPVLYGWWEMDGDGIGIATAVRLERSHDGELNPAVYFSIQPKF